MTPDAALGALLSLAVLVAVAGLALIALVHVELYRRNRNAQGK